MIIRTDDKFLLLCALGADAELLSVCGENYVTKNGTVYKWSYGNWICDCCEILTPPEFSKLVTTPPKAIVPDIVEPIQFLIENNFIRCNEDGSEVKEFST